MQVRVSIDPEVYKEARRLGLNVSVVYELALKKRVKVLGVL